MRTLRRFFARLLHPRPEQQDERLNREIGHYIASQTEENLRAGLSPAEARRQAVLKFGAVESVKEEYRAEGRWPFFDELVQDSRYALRTLRKSPGFAAVAIATIALGIGATTAIFSVVDATLLHPLPYPHPEQLVRVEDDLSGIGSRDVGMSEPEWQDLQHSGIFQYSSPAWYDDNNLTGASRPARVSLLCVAPDYFAVLGVNPELGRTFPPEDHSPSFTYEVVISDGLWKRNFSGDLNVLGRTLRLDTDLYHIVGVMPPDFHDPGTSLRERNIEVWAATSFYGPPMLDHPPRSGRNLPTAIARLAPGMTIDAAQAKLDALVASLQKQFPNDYPLQSGWRIKIVPLKDTVVGNLRQSLLLLLGAVGLVLLIGCVNVANLLLAKASARGREMAIRQAMGAARGRLARQLLTESLLLSLIGGVVGLAVLLSTQKFLVRIIPESLPRFSSVSISWSVLSFAFVVSLVAGAVFGLVPALHAGRVDVASALKREGRGSTGTGEQARARRVLVVTEFALSLVLMISAGLLLRSFWGLLNASLGFRPEKVMTIKTRLPYPNDTKMDAYATATQEAPFLHEVLRRVRNLPGVEEAAMGELGALPLAHDRNNQNQPVLLIIEGSENRINATPLIDDAYVTPEYFHLMGMSIARGRFFDDFDTDKSTTVAVINEAAARTYWPGEDPIGKHVKLRRSATSWITIVGIVRNARTESIENEAVPVVFASLNQLSGKHLAIFLRGNLDEAAIPEQVRAQVQAVDSTIPVFAPQTVSEAVSASLAERRFALEMVTLFAITALLLAAIGIFGVMSYIVSERTHEFGIRLALGARPGNVIVLVLRQGLALAFTGTVVGLVGAVIVSRLMAGVLYGVRPTDPVTFGGVALLFTVVALLACYIPARRTLRVDPIIALRNE
ncbi:MAG TPA: ABC transporter permease [Candidatus Acidoferrales bacterium]|nr:ABC transporter permease [Candidatus Acidoferrales bacterium]